MTIMLFPNSAIKLPFQLVEPEGSVNFYITNSETSRKIKLVARSIKGVISISQHCNKYSSLLEN